MIFGEAFGTKIINIKQLSTKKIGKHKTKILLEKTGPKKIYICNGNEDTLTLSNRAFKRIKKKFTQDVKSLIYVTETPLKQFPGNGFLFATQNKLNENMQIIDINSGCTGFVDALSLALKLKSKSLIVCSEAYSKSSKIFNRTVTTLFSDGAGIFISDPNQLKLIDESFGFKRNTYKDLVCDLNSEIFMDGKKVYNFVVSEMYPELIKMLKRNFIKKYDRIYLHQGSKFIVDLLKDKLKSFSDHIPSNIEKNGNFVSATLPILISQDLKKKPLKNKEIIVLCSFGVGLAYSFLIVEINKSKNN